MKKYSIDQSAADQRIDRYVAKLLPKAKRGQIQRWFRTKKIKLNGVKALPNNRLSDGDEVTLFLPDPLLAEYSAQSLSAAPRQVDLDIVYEDDDLLIVNKPVGLLTHPDKAEYKNTLATRVQHYLQAAVRPTFRPASVNRLDKNTSGLVIFGKNYAALKHYNALMRDAKIKKRYTAICVGAVVEPICLKAHIVKRAEANKVFVVARPRADSKPIHTEIWPQETANGYSKVTVLLHTGRSHQIRVSLAHLGYPIVGDVKYGGPKLRGVTTQLLHAETLIIEDRCYTAPSPIIEDFWRRLKE